MQGDFNVGDTIDSRYQLKSVLGGGRVGQVYLAQDLQKGGDIAIKVLANSLRTERDRAFFSREFTAIKNLNHPGVVQVYEQGIDYFTMEYIEGDSLSQFQESEVSLIFEVGIEITRVLDYIHRQGVIHRDLKPENIKITSEQKVKIIDFGFATCDNLPSSTSESFIAGTINYMAPEMIKGFQVDPRTDLYSLGVIFYELVTGQLPFKSSDLATTMVKQVETVPPLPSNFNKKVTSGFQGIIMKLMEKSPSHRFQSTEELLRAMLRIAGHTDFLDIRVDKGRKFLSSPRTIGLDENLKRLEKALGKATRSRGRFIVLHASEGLGKTRLLREFQSRSARSGRFMLEVNCEEVSGLEVFGSIIDQIFSSLERSEETFLKELVGRWGSTLTLLSPHLNQRNCLKECVREENLSPEELGERICQFFIEISHHYFLCICLDNLHRLDYRCSLILFALAEQSMNHSILLCGTYRSNFGTKESSLEKMLPRFRIERVCEEIELIPFSKDQLSRFLASMVDKDYIDSELRDKIFEISRGIPLLAEETFKNLADDGLIYRQGGEWKIEIDDLRKVRRPNLLEESLVEKYQNLDETLILITQMAVVVGQHFQLKFLEKLSGITLDTLKHLLPKLLSQGFLAEVRENGEAGFIIGSPRLGELIYEKIPPSFREELHLKVAGLLEIEATKRRPYSEELAYHYRNAQVSEKAIAFSIEAGELCEKQFFYSTAIKHYKNALELVEESSGQQKKLDLFGKLGQIYFQIGNYDTALSYCKEGLALAQAEKSEESIFLKGLGLNYLKKGQLQESLENFEILTSTLRGQSQEMAEELTMMASVYIAMGEYTQAESILKEVLDLARDQKNRTLQASIYNSFAEIQYMRGQWPNSMNYYLRAFDLLQLSERLSLKARVAKGIAQIYIQKGRTQEAYRYLEEALYLSQLTGDREYQVLVEIDFGLLCEYRGQLGKAIDMFRECLEKAEDLQIRLGEAYAALHLARTTNLCEKGREPIELISRSLHIFREHKVLWGIAEANRVLAVIYSDQGEYERALEAFSLSEKSFTNINMRWVLVSIYTGVARVLRKVGRIEEANKTLNKALRRAKRYDDDLMLGKIHIQYALFCVESGHDNESLEHFISATVLLERVSCVLELAQAYYEYGRVLLDFERKGESGFIRVAIHQLEKASEIYRKAGMQNMLNRTVLLIKECERESGSAFQRHDLAVKLREFDHEISQLERESEQELEDIKADFLSQIGEDMDRNEVLATMEAKITLVKENMNQRLEEIRTKNSNLLAQVEELKSERESLLILQKISNTINSVLDSDKLLNLIMDMVVKELRAERGFLVLKNAQGDLTFKAARNIDEEELSITETNLSTSIVKKVIRTGEAILTSDAQADGRFQSQSITELKLSSILCVPFTIKDKTLGAVYVDNRFISGLFTGKDLDFLVSFSHQAAIAIENALLYEELKDKERMEQELNIAARIQAGLLPKSHPEVKGIEVYGKMIPARKVGGDYYDYIVSPDNKQLSVVIGDVSGKGIPAGLVMVMARLVLNYFLREDKSTKEILLTTNRLLKDNTEPFMFMSMLLARWDSESSKLVYTGAGHENLIVCRQGGELEVIPAGGVVLGVKDSIEDLLEEKELPLESGDTVILYTDGATESISPASEMLELDGFLKMVKKHQNKPPREIVHSLLEDLRNFVGHGEQHDDITFTVLRKI